MKGGYMIPVPEYFEYQRQMMLACQNPEEYQKMMHERAEATAWLFKKISEIIHQACKHVFRKFTLFKIRRW